MARMLSITRSDNGSLGRKRTLKTPFRLGPVTLSVMTIILVGFLALFFIISTTSTSAEGFELHQMEDRIVELRENNQKLEVELSKLRSLDHLEQSLNESHLNFIPVGQVTAIRLPEDAVAVTNQ